MGNNFKTFILLAGLTALMLGLGRMMGGSHGMLLALVFAVGMNFFSYWFSDKIVLAMSGARPVGPDEAGMLHRIVAGLAQRAGLPMPRLYVIPQAAPNAFATGRNPAHAAVAVTEGLLRALSPEQLEAVLAHEMAHVKHRDILISSVAATLAGALTQLANMLQWSAMFGGWRGDDDRGDVIGGIAAAIVAPIAAMLVQMAISRSREYEADRYGAVLCGHPLALANALVTIDHIAHGHPMAVNPAAAHMYIINPLGAGRMLASLFGTHPPTEERVRRLQAMAASGS